VLLFRICGVCRYGGCGAHRGHFLWRPEFRGGVSRPISRLDTTIYWGEAQTKLRARIRRGLLKVEQLHALARDIYYGRRGRINARELHEQMNSCSCLTLLLACVVYWQAKEISRVLKMGISQGI